MTLAELIAAHEAAVANGMEPFIFKAEDVILDDRTQEEIDAEDASMYEAEMRAEQINESYFENRGWEEEERFSSF